MNKIILGFFLALQIFTVQAVTYINNPVPFYKQVNGMIVKPVSNSYSYQAITWGDSIIAVANKGLFPGGVILVDDPMRQIRNVIEGKTPFARQTIGSGTMLIDALQTAGIQMELFHSVTDSNGGDVIVTRSFKSITEFVAAVKSGKKVTIAIQYGGPHMGWLVDLFVKNNISLSSSNVVIKYLPNLFGDNSPETAIIEDSTIDLAFVIGPSAAAITEGVAAIPGITKLVSTKVMRESIKDSIFVRSDWANANKATLEKIRNAFISSRSKLLDKALVNEAATLIFGSASDQNVADTEGLRDDARFHTLKASNSFLYDPANMNNFPRKVAAIVGEFVKIGIISNPNLTIPVTNWGIKYSGEAVIKKVTAQVTAQIEQEVNKLEQSGQGQVLVSDKINFKANQTEFSASTYGKKFGSVINFANTYPGAVINIVGHVDPSLLRAWNKAIEFKNSGNIGNLMKVENYLNKIPGNNYNLAQMSIQRITMERNNVKNAAERSSKQRANTVKTAIVNYSVSTKTNLDAFKLVVHGDGAGSPVHSNPKNRSQFSENIRVEFNVTNYNAEIDSFSSAQDF